MDLSALRATFKEAMNIASRAHRPSEIQKEEINKFIESKIQEWEFDLITFTIEEQHSYYKEHQRRTLEMFARIQNPRYTIDYSDAQIYHDRMYSISAVLELYEIILRELGKTSLSKIRSSAKGKKFDSHPIYKLQSELRTKPTITNKLNFLRDFKESNIDAKVKGLGEFIKGSVPFVQSKSRQEDKILEDLFPDVDKFVTPLLIPDKIYDRNFDLHKDDPEFTFWFLKHNAKEYFEYNLMRELETGLRSPLRLRYIKRELEKIETFEVTTLERFDRNEIHSYNNPEGERKHRKETELLRIIEDYYEANTLEFVHAGGNPAVEMYARHKFLKPFLEESILEFKADSSSRGGNIDKIPANFYALYHWILIEIGQEKFFPRNEDDKYPKQDIIDFAATKYPSISSESFYRAFINIDLTKKTAIPQNFGSGYKEKLIKISGNSAKMISHLRGYPN